MTTHVLVKISAAAFNEIAEALREGGYPIADGDTVIMSEGLLINGIGLIKVEIPAHGRTN
jgi:hypothetical protein